MPDVTPADTELRRNCNTLSLLAAVVVGAFLFLFVKPPQWAGLIIVGLIPLLGGPLAFRVIRHRRRAAEKS